MQHFYGDSTILNIHYYLVLEVFGVKKDWLEEVRLQRKADAGADWWSDVEGIAWPSSDVPHVRVSWGQECKACDLHVINFSGLWLLADNDVRFSVAEQFATRQQKLRADATSFLSALCPKEEGPLASPAGAGAADAQPEARKKHLVLHTNTNWVNEPFLHTSPDAEKNVLMYNRFIERQNTAQEEVAAGFQCRCAEAQHRLVPIDTNSMTSLFKHCTHPGDGRHYTGNSPQNAIWQMLSNAIAASDRDTAASS